MKKDVHTEHCSVYGCKYGEEDSCSVYLGYKPASFPQEDETEIHTLPEEVFIERRNAVKQSLEESRFYEELE